MVSGYGSGSEIASSDEDEALMEYREGLTSPQMQPWSGPEALQRAALLIEGLKVSEKWARS